MKGKELEEKDNNTLGPTDREFVRPKSARELGLNDIEEVEIVNPMTQKKSLVTIDRSGTTEEKMIQVMSSSDFTREQKDHVLGMYMWERGKENSSFLMDLFRYKGQHSKESQAFKRQMRFDFEQFIGAFTTFLHDASFAVAKEFGLDNKKWEKVKEDTVKYRADIEKTLKANKIKTDPHTRALFSLALRMESESGLLASMVEETTVSRLREKGYGIFINSEGKIYDIFDKNVVNAVKEDVEKNTKVDNKTE